MEREDPPLLGNNRNIYQRFFADLYRQEVSPPPTPTPDLNQEELEQQQEEERAQQEEEEKKKKASKDKGKPGKPGSAPKPDPKATKAKDGKAKSGASTPAVADPVEAEFPPPPPEEPVVQSDGRYDEEIKLLEEDTSNLIERNKESLADLQRRREQLFLVEEVKHFDAETAMEHAEKLVTGCINIARIIRQQDVEFSSTYKVPSVLEQAKPFNPDDAPSEWQSKSFASTKKVNVMSSIGLNSSFNRTASGGKKKEKRHVEDAALLTAERSSMTRMNAIANHLVNPRFAPPGYKPALQAKLRANAEATSVVQLKYVQPLPACPLRLSQLTEGTGMDTPVLLCAEPTSLHFTGYKPGGTYEQTIKIRNVSQIARRCRVIPPTTAHFSVSLHKPLVCLKSFESPQMKTSASIVLRQQNGTAEQNSSGLIAPGMAVSYVVRFNPDSLSNFEDRLQVCSEWNSFEVVLQATRPPPMLSLPDVIECGYCILQGTKKQILKVMNSGGDSSFCFSSDAQRPLPDDERELIVTPFTIKPKTFSLRSGECQDVSIVFSPEAEESYCSEVYLFCDNGDAMRYCMKGEGTAATITLASINDNVVNNDSPFMTNNTLLTFDELSVGGVSGKSVTYYNPTEVAVRFHWRLLTLNQDTGETMTDGSVFGVTPAQGSFKPRAHKRFNIEFHPNVAASYKTQMQLVLEGVNANSAVKHPFETTTPVLDASVDSFGFFSSGLFSDAIDKAASEQVAAVSVVEAIGAAKPLDIALHPAVIANLSAPYVAGAMLLSQRQIHLVNNSMCSAWFCFDPTEEDTRMIQTGSTVQLQQLAKLRTKQVEDEARIQERGLRVMFSPHMGCVNPGSTVVVTMQYAFIRAGLLDLIVECAVQRIPQPLQLKLMGEVQGATVRVDPEVIDFGVIHGVNEAESRVTLYNDSEVLLNFDLVSPVDVKREQQWLLARQQRQQQREAEIEHYKQKWGTAIPPDAFPEEAEEEFAPLYSFVPDSGKLLPHQNMVVSIFYEPIGETTIKDVIEVRTKGAEAKQVEVLGEVQSPKACIYPSTVELQEAFMAVPVTRTVELRNLSSIETAFQWAIIEDTALAHTTFSVPSGVLKAGEKKKIDITITVHRPGPLKLLIPCCLAGVAQPVACAVTCADVVGAKMSFTISPERPVDPPLDHEDGRTASEFCDHLMQNLVNGILGDDPLQWLPAVEFGTVPLGQLAEQYLTIRNHSGSRVDFECSFAQYKIREDYPTLLQRAKEGPSNKAGTILGDAHEKTMPFGSKGGASFVADRTKAKVVQKLTGLAVDQAGGRGLAFMMDQSPQTPYCIPPGGIIVLPLRCAANLPGVYEDEVVVYANPDKGLPEARIPVRVEVAGSVLKVHKITTGITAGVNEASLKFQPLVLSEAAPAVSKQLHLANACPTTLDVEWRATGPHSDRFRVEPMTTRMAPGATQCFTVHFAAPEAATASATFSSLWECRPQIGLPLRLDVAASIIAPSLEVNPRTVKFLNCPATDPQLVKTIRLTNSQSKSLQFTVTMEAEAGSTLEITKLTKICDPADPEPTAPAKVPLRSKVQLFSHESLDVTVAFVPSQCSAFEAVDEVEAGNTHVRHVAAHVRVHFGSLDQNVPVECSVHFPFLTLDRAALAFEAAANDAAWPKTIELCNRSIVPAEYEICYVSNPKPVSTQAAAPPAPTPGERLKNAVEQVRPIDDAAAFQISPMRGVVPGKTHNQAGTAKLTVAFTPPSAAPFCSMYKIDVRNGIGCELELKGSKPLQEHSDIMFKTMPSAAATYGH